MENTNTSLEASRKDNEAFVQNLSGDILDRCMKSIFRYYEDGRQEMTDRKWGALGSHGRCLILRMEAEAIIKRDERKAESQAEAERGYYEYDFDGPAPF